jgi:hypothetical protein
MIVGDEKYVIRRKLRKSVIIYAPKSWFLVFSRKISVNIKHDLCKYKYDYVQNNGDSYFFGF